MHEMCFNLNKYHCEKYIANFTKSVIRSQVRYSSLLN